jgi:hypothetical protein
MTRRSRKRHAFSVLALVASLASPGCRPSSPPKSTSVTLAWNYSASAPPIEGFLVYRRTGAGPWQEVGRVGATQVTFTDAIAPQQTSLCYQVRAYRGQEYSPPSNEICVTRPAS